MANKNIEVTTFVDDCEKIVNIGGVLVWDLKDELNPIYLGETVMTNSDEEAKEMLGISDAFLELVFNKGVYPIQILLRPTNGEMLSLSSISKGGGGVVTTVEVFFTKSHTGSGGEVSISRFHNADTNETIWSITKN